MSARLLRIAGSALIAVVALIAVLAWPHSTRGVANANTLCVQPGNISCFSSISAALNAAQNGDTIQVAAGTYIEYVAITKSVTLQGGWNSTFTARDPSIYIALIRPPDSSFSVVDIEGPAAPTLDGFTVTGGGGGNHGGGIRVRGSNAIVSNNTITGNVSYLLGGGIWVQGGAPIIQNNRIENNHITPSIGGWGGGVELEGTQATLIGNVIANNAISDSVGYGGGVAVQGGGPVTLTANTIMSNAAAIITSTTPQYDVGYGGGVYVWGAPVKLTGNLVQGNAANAVSAFGFGGAFGHGGGVDIVNTPAFTLTGNTIISNTAGYKYYAYLSGGGLEVESSAGSLTDNVISGNHANGNILFGNGGGLAVFTSTLSIQGGQILNNVTAINYEGYGGGLYATNSSITLDAVRMENNRAANSPSYGLGGGLAFFKSPYTLTNAIIDNNYAYDNDTSVGGLFADVNSPGLVINNTFANNKGQGIRVGAALTATNNILQGRGVANTTGISLTGAAPVSVTFNNFYNYPFEVRGFVLASSNIVINPQLDSAFHLSSNSPAIDAGTRANASDHDFDRQPRPMMSTSGLFRFDIGADEIVGTAQTNRHLAAQPADFTLIGPGNPKDNPDSTGPSDWIGYAVMGGDINADNRADLVAGAPNLSDMFDGGPDDSGRVFSLDNTGARRLGIVDLYTTTANLEVRSWLNQQHIGQAMAANDLDGDGRRDLIIGATGASNFDITGTIFVFAGGANLSGTRTLSPTMQATYRIRSDQNTSSFGGANALAAGQLDGAGPDDLAVGEANATVAGRANAGAVYVFFGGPGLPALWDMRVLSASLTIDGPTANANLGEAAVADVNGDGKPDLIARSSSTLYVFYGPLAPGVIDLAASPANLMLNGLSDGRLATGDVDGDGKADIVLGDGNQVKVIRGSTFTLLATFTGVTASALHTLDWNGDGKADVVIGEHPQERAFVVLGSATLSGTANVVERASWIIYGENAGDQFGYSLGSGDLDADGAADLIVGARSHSVNDHSNHFDDAGAVYVLYGQRRKIYLPLVLK